MTDQELLLKAAQHMLDEHGLDHPRHDMWVAMADLLYYFAQYSASSNGIPALRGRGLKEALQVARVYLDAPR